MKPDAFMPFYFRDFFEAVKGQPDHFGMGYLRALSFYWGHNHCAGLKDDDDFLRRLCEIETAEWPSAKEFIFDNDHNFSLDADGLWQQKRCQAEWIKTKAKYDKAVAGGKNRWQSIPKAERPAIMKTVRRANDELPSSSG